MIFPSATSVVFYRHLGWSLTRNWRSALMRFTSGWRNLTTPNFDIDAIQVSNDSLKLSKTWPQWCWRSIDINSDWSRRYPRCVYIYFFTRNTQPILSFISFFLFCSFLCFFFFEIRWQRRGRNDPRNNDYIHPNQRGLNGCEQHEFEPIYLSTSALNPLIRFRIMQIQRRARRAPTFSTGARGRDTRGPATCSARSSSCSDSFKQIRGCTVPEVSSWKLA